ncbi:LysR family transcriptional regulator [Hydrogenophaga sp. UC242_53]|uniref:helix-turn-helix domain-containing protein n=1 Tax=Hydrogenophaga sp. UC242_53 TaxID=3350170 RepID=UPI0036D33E44
MNIDNKDLNLLRVFHVVYQERNASRAAERLALSQPALSQQAGQAAPRDGRPALRARPAWPDADAPGA